MVVGFSVGNYRSFLTEQSLSFIATADASHQNTHCVSTNFQALPRLTRTAVVFGPNASGKSNLLAAIRTMRDFVLNSTHFSESDYRERYTPFCTTGSAAGPTTFAIDLVLDRLRYRYSFAYDSERILAEDLRVYRNSKSQRWFGRRSKAGQSTESWEPFSARFPGPREMWRKATRPRALFVTTANQLGAEVFAPLMRWFEHQLDVALSDDVSDLKPFAARLVDPIFKSNVLRVLQAVDIPVLDVRVTESGTNSIVSGEAQPALAIQFAYAKEGQSPRWVDPGKDSSGARKLTCLLCPLLDGIERDRFVAIDEFDTHLHPLVARFLVQIISDPTATHRRVQVLLGSHTTSLMDLTILRRDEVWLIETDEKRASRLNSLMKFSPRKSEAVAKSYLRGAYGAVPQVRFDESQFAMPKALAPAATTSGQSFDNRTPRSVDLPRNRRSA